MTLTEKTLTLTERIRPVSPVAPEMSKKVSILLGWLQEWKLGAFLLKYEMTSLQAQPSIGWLDRRQLRNPFQQESADSAELRHLVRSGGFLGGRVGDGRGKWCDDLPAFTRRAADDVISLLNEELKSLRIPKMPVVDDVRCCHQRKHYHDQGPFPVNSCTMLQHIYKLIQVDEIWRFHNLYGQFQFPILDISSKIPFLKLISYIWDSW